MSGYGARWMTERRQGRLSRRALVGATCAGGLALALGAGAWAGHATAPEAPAQPAATRVVQAGGARLVVPREWRTQRATDGVATFAPTLGSDERVLVTLAPAEDPSLVPLALRALVRDVDRRPRPTWLAGHRAWLYSGLRGRSADSVIDLTVLPSGGGVLGVACVSRDWDSNGGCASSIGAVSLGGGTPIFAPSDDLALRLRLPDALAALDRARVGMRARLRHANTVAGQARLARGLARAHLAAAASLRPVAGSAGAPLVASLSRAGRAYLVLAREATGGSVQRFAAARQAVETADARLSGAVDRLTPPAAPGGTVVHAAGDSSAPTTGSRATGTRSRPAAATASRAGGTPSRSAAASGSGWWWLLVGLALLGLLAVGVMLLRRRAARAAARPTSAPRAVRPPGDALRSGGAPMASARRAPPTPALKSPTQTSAAAQRWDAAPTPPPSPRA